MTTFLAVLIALYLIMGLMHFWYLAENDYPRVVYYKPWQDALGLLINIAIVAWAVLLLNTK